VHDTAPRRSSSRAARAFRRPNDPTAVRPCRVHAGAAGAAGLDAPGNPVVVIGTTESSLTGAPGGGADDAALFQGRPLWQICLPGTLVARPQARQGSLRVAGHPDLVPRRTNFQSLSLTSIRRTCFYLVGTAVEPVTAANVCSLTDAEGTSADARDVLVLDARPARHRFAPRACRAACLSPAETRL
jgi:hypothetical protein